MSARAPAERAQAALSGVDVVGLQEEFDDFCVELNRRFGWLLGSAVRVNENPGLAASDELTERIAADNVLDIELYEFAHELCRQRRAESSSGPSTMAIGDN